MTPPNAEDAAPCFVAARTVVNPVSTESAIVIGQQPSLVFASWGELAGSPFFYCSVLGNRLTMHDIRLTSLNRAALKLT